MLTDKEIREALKKDPYWEPAEDATMEEWALYDSIYEEMDSKGELKFKDSDLDDLEDDELDDEDIDDLI